MKSRKQRIIVFWVLVFSLNLIPLVASGEPANKPANRHPAAPPASAPAAASTAASASAPSLTRADLDSALNAAGDRIADRVASAIANRNTTVANDAATTAASPAPAGSPTPGRYRFDDLTAADTSATFMNFQAAIDGQDPSNRALLYGMVFDDCKAFFQFSSTRTDSTIATNGVAGFRIRDVGGSGRDCMAQHKSRNDVCSATNPCTRLSQIPGASMDLSSMGDVAIKLYHLDPNQDPGAPNLNPWEAFDSANALTHTSAATLALRAADAANRAKQAQIDLARQQIRGCRANSDELNTARGARDFLVSVGALSESEVRILNRELDRAELTALMRRADRGSIDDMDSLREDLAAWVAAHPDSADAALGVCHKIALRYVNQRGAGPDAYDSASAAVSECSEYDGISDANSQRLQSYQRDIQVGRVQVSAGNPMVFWPSYYNLMNQMQQDTMNACFNNSASMENCANARSAMMNAQALPQREQQVEMSRYQMQMQMQQQMAQSGMGPGSMGGMPGGLGGGAWAGGYYGGGGSQSGSFYNRNF